MARYFGNSVILVAASLALCLLLSSMTAFILAKYKFFGSQVILNTYLSGQMVPAVITLVPLFFLSQSLHMTNNYIGLILIYAVTGLPFAIFLLMGFFKNIPDSYIEAARIDGGSDYYIFFKVILPLAKPGLVAASVIQVLNCWNEYIIALTFLADEKYYTVPIGLSYLSATFQYRTDFGALFAGLTIALVPVLVVYIIFQRQLQEGMAAGGIKG